MLPQSWKHSFPQGGKKQSDKKNPKILRILPWHTQEIVHIVLPQDSASPCFRCYETHLKFF